MKGRSTSGTTGLGSVEVSGRRARPLPTDEDDGLHQALRTDSPAPDALVVQAGRLHRRAVEGVAAVDHEGAVHRRRGLRPVERLELVPLGDEHDGVGVLHALQRPRGELDAVDEAAGLVLGDRVIDAHRRPGRLEAGREDERAGLAHVVGVRLEGEAEQGDLLADQRVEVLDELADNAALLQLVDLDDRVEQLEVIAGVAGELLERVDVLGEARAAEADAPPAGTSGRCGRRGPCRGRPR